MKTWYAKFIDKISYRIYFDKVQRFLAEESRGYDDYLSRRYLSSRLGYLLQLLKKEDVTPEDQEWIVENAFAKDATKERSYYLLLSQMSLNNIAFINRYFIQQNKLLRLGGHFVCWFQTSLNRKAEIFQRYPIILCHILYFFDVLWHRICPKLPWIRNLYFAATKGRHRVFPRPEILGRLYCCGFQVVDEFSVENKFYVVVKKIRPPFNDPHPSYGPFIRLHRIGKNGLFFDVYKFRTMHAYSEYLQTYIYDHLHLAEGGKFKNDFRIPVWGRFMRKYWLDELPMILNILKGDMKLIGVRPLSEQYYNLYSPELQHLRILTKPGLLPPYYADMPKTLEEIEASETKYLEQYLKHPFQTDWIYFWKILNNIIIRKKRSA